MKAREYSLRVGSLFAPGKLLLVVCTLIIATAAPVSAQTVAPKRVVVLYWDNKEFPGNVRFEESLKAELQLDHRQDVEYFPEYFEFSRFPEDSLKLSFRNYLQAKYANRTVDVVVASANAPLSFLL